MKKAAVLLLLCAVCILNYIATDSTEQDPYLITDYSRLHPVKVDRVVGGKEERQLVKLVNNAREEGMKIAIAGQRHSQGGHTYYKDAIVVDMTSYDRILAFEPERKQITVQAGITWEQIQEAINPYGLAVKTMQSQNIFTVGGSISINAHGRDIRNGSMIKSVESFRLLKADGRIVNVSREQNKELFGLALGGFGLFGIILDVTLSLTQDELYRTTTDEFTVKQYAGYFKDEVLADPDVRMHIARVSVAPFLEEMYAINYVKDHTEKLEDYDRLRMKENWVVPAKALFQISRFSDWGKSKLWSWQKNYFSSQEGKRISRNNAMRSESEFMTYTRAGSNDVLQEYFIPVDRFSSLIEAMKAIVPREKLNLLNITVRYVNQDEEAQLSYAKQDMFALVCLFHVKLSEAGQRQAEQGIRQIIDAVLGLGGSYYLPYVSYPSIEQFRQSYPNHEAFFQGKKQADPKEMFMNAFYEKYDGGE